MDGSVEQRLERVEASLERLIGLMESSAGGQGVNVAAQTPARLAGGSVAVGATRGAAALDAALGAEAVREQVAELVMRLGDPDTLGAITRIAQLAPSLEYALTSVAAGPELLEEGLELARERMGGSGIDADLQQRMQAGADALLAMSEPTVTRTLSRLVAHTPAFAPLVEGAAEGVQRLRVVEGDAALRDRLAEVVCRVAEPDTLDAIGRLVTLLPDLEYAVNALAAGPALLEEGFEVAHARLAEAGISSGEVTRRTEAAALAVEKLSRPGTLDALGRVASALPEVQPMVLGLARGARDLAEAEGGTQLEERLAESIVRIAEPETLDALTRIATLAPSLEYAVNALAAGPALLEEALDVAKERMEQTGEAAPLQPRIDAAGRALLRLTRPQTLDALGVLADALPPLAPVAQAATVAMSQLAELEGPEALSERLTETIVTLTEPETLAALTRLASLAPKLEYAGYFVAAGPELLEEGLEMVRSTLGQERTPEVQQALTAGLKLMGTLGEPQVLRSLTELTEVLPGLLPRGSASVKALESLTRKLPELAETTDAVDFVQVRRTLDAVDLGAVATVAKSVDWAALATLAEQVDLAKVATLVGKVDLTKAAALVGAVDLTTLTQLVRALDMAAVTKLLGAVDLAALTKLLETVDLGQVSDLLGKVDLQRMGAFVELIDGLDPAQLRALLDAVELPKVVALAKATDLDALATVLGAVDAQKLANLLASEATHELLDGLVHLVEDDPSRQAILEVIAMAPRLRRSLAALPTEGATLGLLATVNRAVAEAAEEKRSAGVFGSLSALRDPKVQRVMGFFFDVAERLGGKLDDPKALVEAGMVRSKPKGSD